MLHGTVEQHSEQRAGPLGGRPCAQALRASPEQAKALEPAQVRVLHSKLAISRHAIAQASHPHSMPHSQPL